MISKNVWRTRMLEVRSQLGPDKASEFNRLINKNLLFVFAEAGVSQSAPVQKWAAYKSFRWEADPTQAIIDTEHLIQWAYPRMKDEHTIEFYVPQKPVDSKMAASKPAALWSKNKLGIWEPDPRTSQKINLNEVSGVLVPGLAFDRQGYRLGYGKGFYDKSLAGYKGLKVGIGFSLQVVNESLPSDTNDILMDFVVTENEIIRTKH